MTEDEIVSGSKDPEKTRKLRERPYKFFVWVSIFAVLSYILIGNIAFFVPTVAFFVLWLTFANWCYSTPLIQLRRNKWVQFSFQFLPAFAIVAYSAGYSEGTDAAFRYKSNITINAVGNDTNIEGAYLRGFESGLLYLTKDDKPTFIRWDSISSYAFEAPYSPYKGILCSWFDICSEFPGKISNANSTHSKSN